MNGNRNPLISIIIPYYNPPFEYFKEAIYSILAQSYDNWESIIVNDGSTKESKLALEAFIKDINDNRISLINLEKNSGVSVAKNTGIKAAKGEIITFLDADDLFLPWHLQENINAFAENPDCHILAFPFLYYYSVWKTKKIAVPGYVARIFKKRELAHIVDRSIEGKLMLRVRSILTLKKEVFEKVNFDPSLSSAEDTDLCLQILNNNDLSNKVAAKLINGYLYRFYPNKNRLSLRSDLEPLSKEKLKAKYREENTIAGEIVSIWSSLDEWESSKLFANYLSNGSLFQYFKDISISQMTIKEKIKKTRALVKAIISFKLTMPLFGLNYGLFRDYIRFGNNKYKAIKTIFQEHLKETNNGKTNLHSKQLFKRLFSTF